MFVEGINLIFVHIPKNGGTSITKFLKKNFKTIGDGHLRGLFEYSKYKHLSPASLCVVRDPLDRAYSNYCYSKMKKSFHHSFDGDARYGIHPDYKLLEGKSFKDYLRLLKKNKIKGYGGTSQSMWIKDVPDMNYLNFENLNNSFFNFFNSKYNIKNANLKKINISKKPNNYIFSEEEKDIVKEIYKDDYLLLKNIKNSEKYHD